MSALLWLAAIAVVAGAVPVTTRMGALVGTVAGDWLDLILMMVGTALVCLLLGGVACGLVLLALVAS